MNSLYSRDYTLTARGKLARSAIVYFLKFFHLQPAPTVNC